MINEKNFKELLSDHQIYHSAFQIDHFITTKAGGTLYGMYCQALRELDGRFEALKSMMVDRKIELAEAKELEEEAMSIPPGTKRKILQLKALKKRMTLDGLDRALYHKIREFIQFYYQATRLKEEIGELGETKRAVLEHDTWLYRLKLQLYVDVISSGRPSNGTIENILSLGKNDRSELLQYVENPGMIAEHFNGASSKIDLPSYSAKIDEIATLWRMIDVEPGGGDGKSPHKPDA